MVRNAFSNVGAGRRERGAHSHGAAGRGASTRYAHQHKHDVGNGNGDCDYARLPPCLAQPHPPNRASHGLASWPLALAPSTSPCSAARCLEPGTQLRGLSTQPLTLCFIRSMKPGSFSAVLRRPWGNGAALRYGKAHAGDTSTDSSCMRRCASKCMHHTTTASHARLAALGRRSQQRSLRDKASAGTLQG